MTPLNFSRRSYAVPSIGLSPAERAALIASKTISFPNPKGLTHPLTKEEEAFALRRQKQIRKSWMGNERSDYRA